jgi:eukaryotic-like serine/threonine-protein kinase
VDVLGRDRRGDPLDRAEVLARVRAGLFGRSSMPPKLARYELLETLGRGGFGVVYLARDPELDRKVAIKVLHCGKRGTAGDAKQRLHREAQALARFSHPNVVSVYDVGTQRLESGDETLFVVMELVDGTPLDQWMRAHPRGWKEVLAVFDDAGRGLAAAHDQGLVHRDFKPANVMVGPDMTATVLDFGLARLAAARRRSNDDATPAAPSWRASTDSLADPITADGSVPGTPAYMAPEQHDGAAGSARSDQYSFCVALYEALHGVRPFDVSDVRALKLAKRNEAIRDAPSGTAVPSRVHRAMMRGLRADPDARWPSMQALLAQLRAPSRRGRRVLLGVGVTTIAGGVAFAASPSRSRCAPPSLEGIWDPPTIAELEHRFMQTGLAHAPQTWERVQTRLDAYAQRWSASMLDACKTAERHRTILPRLEARMACLERRGAQLEALTASFARPDREVVERALQAVTALPPVDPCVEQDGLGAAVEPPAGPEREDVLAARRHLATVAVLQHLGKYEEGFELAREAVRLAERGGHPPGLAEARLRLGKLASAAGHYELAAEELGDASRIAVEHGLDELAATAEIALVTVMGDRLLRFEDALRWGKHARAKIDRLGGASTLHADLLAALGNVAYRQGRHNESRALHAECLERRLAVLGHEHPDTGLAYNNLANAMLELGQVEEAIAAYERGLAITERVHGPDHPVTSWSVNNLGSAEVRRGDFDAGRRHYLRALRIRESSLPIDHPDVTGVLMNLGGLEQQAGNLDEARLYLQRALDLQEGTQSDPVAVAGMLDNLALVHSDAGDHEEAHRLLVRSLMIRRDRLGDHETTAITIHNLGHVEARRGNCGEARAHYEEAVDILEQVSEVNVRLLGYALHGLGECLIDLGEAGAAVQSLERALDLHERGEGDPRSRAESRFALARALWDRGEDHDRQHGVELARSALDDLRPTGQRAAATRRRIERWLEERERMP